MHKLFILATIIGALGFIGCKNHHGDGPPPPPPEYLRVEVNELNEATATISNMPEHHYGLLYLNGATTALAIVLENGDVKMGVFDVGTYELCIEYFLSEEGLSFYAKGGYWITDAPPRARVEDRSGERHCAGFEAKELVPYANKFLTGAIQEKECIRIMTKTPEGYISYLTIDDDNQAAVLVFRTNDELVNGVPVSVEDVVVCGLTLDTSHHLVLEIRSNDDGGRFGSVRTETLDVFLNVLPPRPVITLDDNSNIVITGILPDCPVALHNSQLDKDIVLEADGIITYEQLQELLTSAGSYFFRIFDCYDLIEARFGPVVIVHDGQDGTNGTNGTDGKDGEDGKDYLPPEPNPCLPNLNFLPRGGSTKVLSDRLQGVLDSLHMGGKARLHATTDFVQEGLDAYWQINTPDGYGPVEGDAAALIVIELAGFKDTNTFGIYDAANPSNRIQLFGGSAGATSSVELAIMSDGKVKVNDVLKGTFGSTRFGLYLDSHFTSGGALFFSESRLNPDHKDHMVAYQGDNDVIIDPPGIWPAEVFRSDEFILGFEDLVSLPTPSATLAGCIVVPPSDPSDWDYEDMVILISGVRPRSCD